MISDTARHKLLVLSGQCYENTGELILQSGSFSFFNFIDIFTDQEVSKRAEVCSPYHMFRNSHYIFAHWFEVFEWSANMKRLYSI